MLSAAITPFLIFSAWLLLLLVTLSVPIIKDIYLLTLTSDVASSFLNASLSAKAHFGVWGYCVQSITIS